MSRLENILSYKENRDAEALRKEQADRVEVEAMITKVKALKPRIEELLKMANACYQSNISLEDFITEGIHHQLGFVRTWGCDNRSKNNTFEWIGFDMGGACGCYDFCTNGEDILDIHADMKTRRLPQRSHLERFLENFDSFEERFYQYVDELTGAEQEPFVQERRRVLFTFGMSHDMMLIITDAPINAIKGWCKRYNKAREDGTYGSEVTLFDTLKKDYYVRLLHDSEMEQDNEDVDIIGYDDVYDFDDYMPSEERYIVMQDFNTKAWKIYDDETDSFVCTEGSEVEILKALAKLTGKDGE